MLYHLSIIVFDLILMTIVVYILSKYLVKPMVSVVDDINDLSLVYKLKNKVVPINLRCENIIILLQENIIDLLNNSKYTDREINFNYENEKVISLCDKKYFKRAINNIIINSLEHNSKGTVVNVSLLEEEGRIKIIIEDNGQEIKEEDLIYIFDRYYKGVNSNSSYKGSGLGMEIAKEIIIYHNGSINIESEVGVGTKITIVL